METHTFSHRDRSSVERDVREYAADAAPSSVLLLVRSSSSDIGGLSLPAALLGGGLVDVARGRADDRASALIVSASPRITPACVTAWSARP